MDERINFATTFQTPITAKLNGQDVRLIALGDIEGMSPCYLYVDNQGKSQWAPIRGFVVNDPHSLPVSYEGLGLGTGSGTSSPVRR